MKRLGLFAAAILAVSCVSQPATPPEAEPQPVAPVAKAPVRKERIEEYKVPVVVKETVSFADGVVDKVISYGYGEGYAILLSSVARKPSSSEPSERIAFEYAGGRLSVKSTFGPDGALSSKCVYEYNGSGELVRETILDGKGVIQSVSEWIWDNGRKSSWRVLSAAGVVMARTDYFYEGDRLASTKLMDGSGNAKGRIEYSYAEGDKLAKVLYFNAAGAPEDRKSVV